MWVEIAITALNASALFLIWRRSRPRRMSLAHERLLSRWARESKRDPIDILQEGVERTVPLQTRKEIFNEQIISKVLIPDTPKRLNVVGVMPIPPEDEPVPVRPSEESLDEEHRKLLVRPGKISDHPCSWYKHGTSDWSHLKGGGHSGTCRAPGQLGRPCHWGPAIAPDCPTFRRLRVV